MLHFVLLCREQLNVDHFDSLMWADVDAYQLRLARHRSSLAILRHVHNKLYNKRGNECYHGVLLERKINRHLGSRVFSGLAQADFSRMDLARVGACTSHAMSAQQERAVSSMSTEDRQYLEDNISYTSLHF